MASVQQRNRSSKTVPKNEMRHRRVDKPVPVQKSFCQTNCRIESRTRSKNLAPQNKVLVKRSLASLERLPRQISSFNPEISLFECPFHPGAQGSSWAGIEKK